MNIIIVGCNRVGSRLASMFAQAGHEVTIIDESEAAFVNLSRDFEGNRIVGIGFDARHSYEDAIMPVEEFYGKWHRRIAVLGGIDVDFLCRRPLEEITDRSRRMLARAAAAGGGYALGTGNSVPEYISDERYLAMTRAALEG